MGSTIFDDDLDGKANRLLLDENEDKKVDVIAYDDDKNGEWDRFKELSNLKFLILIFFISILQVLKAKKILGLEYNLLQLLRNLLNLTN